MFWIVKSACPNGTILFSFTKKNGVNASTELWTIHAPDSHEVLYSSWIPADNQTETRVECITKTSNLQYELVMTGMWKIPNYLEIQGLYGNRVFKGMMTTSGNQTEPFLVTGVSIVLPRHYSGLFTIFVVDSLV